METKPLLEYTFAAFIELPEEERASLRFGTYSTAGIKDIPDMLRRMHEYVHMQSLNSCATSLADLNRRYSKHAKALGITASDGVHQLIRQGKLVDVQYLRKHGLFASNIYKDMIQSFEVAGFNRDDFHDKAFG